MKGKGKRDKFSAICLVERFPGIVNNYRGVICYLPKDFERGEYLRVTVERQPKKRTKRA